MTVHQELPTDKLTPPAAERPASRRAITIARLTRGVEAYTLPVLVVLTAIFFSVWPTTADTFATAGNLRILVANQAVIGIIALGALIPLVAGEWDLSVGSVAGLSSIFAAVAMSQGVSVLLAVLLAVGLGLVVGVANGLIVTRFRVNGVITTLGMSTILDGVVNQKTSGLAINTNIPDSVVNFGYETWLGIPQVVYVTVVVAILAAYVLNYTPFGRYLYAVGSNPSAARLVGIRSGVVIGAAFVACGALSAVGGALQVARQAGADPRVGAGFTLAALAAAFLSAASIKPGKYNVGGVIVAILFLAVLNNGLAIAGAERYVTNYVNGAALIIGVGLSAYLGRRRARSSL